MGFFLLLDPAQGGTRFGPFVGVWAHLGSDAAQCHIVLPAALGVWPVHCMVGPAPQGGVMVQGAAVGAAVFVDTGGGPRPVAGSALVPPGCAIVVASPQGPRFFVEAAAGAGAPGPGLRAAAAGRGPRSLPTGAQMAAELKRQAGVAAMTTGPLAQLSSWWFRARSGALLHPRVVVGAAVAAGGAALVACAGLGAAVLHKLQGASP